MYARLLFVVVGIFGPFLARFGLPALSQARFLTAKRIPLGRKMRLLSWNCALASPEAADIRWRYE
jgi:hypothetical protein